MLGRPVPLPQEKSMYRSRIRSLGTLSMALLGLAAMGNTAFGQQQGWMFQGGPGSSWRGGESNVSQGYIPESYAPPSQYTNAPAGYETTFAIPTQSMAIAAAPTVTSAIEVEVPASAKLYFDNKATDVTGKVRDFVARPLLNGQPYHYEVRAEWKDGSRDIQRTREVTFIGGQPVNIDFMHSPGSVTH
jgi:uncharacterized protein (TIGR03000 family)